MFRDLQTNAGGVNRFFHNRVPAAIENQTVIRLNRDTLYSFAVVDLAAGATLTVPEHGDQYMSAMVVDQDHFVDAIFHDTGIYELVPDQFGTRYVVVAVRVLVDPTDPADLATVARIQDQIEMVSESAEPFAYPDYDTASLDGTRSALLALARNLTGFDRMFGTRAKSNRSGISSGPLPAGVGCRARRRRTSVSSPGFPSGGTSSRSAVCRSMVSGRSRFTTPEDSSRRTTVTPTR